MQNLLKWTIAGTLALGCTGLALAESIAPGLWPDFVAKDDPTAVRSESMQQPRDGMFRNYRFVGGTPAAKSVSEPQWAGAFIISLPAGPMQCMEGCRKMPSCVAWDLRPVQPGRKEGFQMAQRLCSLYTQVPPYMSRLMRAIDDSHNIDCEDLDHGQHTPCAAGIVPAYDKGKSVPVLIPGVKVKPK